MTIVLRPDQAKLKADVYQSWQQGALNTLAVLPTGGGKSIVVSDIVLDQERQGRRQAVLAHRTELVGQMSMHIANRGIPHAIIAPRNVVAAITNDHRRAYGRSFVNPDAQCAVSAVQTLVARKDTMAQWCAQVDDWTIDEAHHVLASNLWGTAVSMFPRARGLGVTATPKRADGMGLGRHADGVFDAMCIGPDMRWLIDNGALTDYEIVCPQSDLVVPDEAITNGGDYSPKKLAEASRSSHIVGDVVKEYVKYAYGKRGICFATDVETSHAIAQSFADMGIPAAAVSAKTPSDTRAEYIRRFRDGRLWVLVNVDLFGEGFDVPACEVVMMARPTASLGLYLQMFGRALRTMSGKLYGLIIDHVSNVIRHGLPDKSHFWSLDRRDKKSKRDADPEEMPMTGCRECSRPYFRMLPTCPHCGHEPVPVPALRGSIEQVDGDLVLLDRSRLEEMRAATILPSPADVGNRAAFVAGEIAGKAAANRAIERQGAQDRLRDAMARWAGVQRYKGRDDRQTHKRFYLATGIDVLSALALPRADMDALTARIEGWL